MPVCGSVAPACSTSCTFTAIGFTPRRRYPWPRPAARTSPARCPSANLRSAPGSPALANWSMLQGSRTRTCRGGLAAAGRGEKAEDQLHAPPLQDLARRDNLTYTLRNEGEGSPPGASADREQGFAVLNGIGKALTSSLDIGEVMHVILAKVSELLKPSNWSLLLKDPVTDGFFHAAVGAGSDKLLGMRLQARRRDRRLGGAAQPAAAGPRRPRRQAIRHPLRQGVALPAARI